MTLRSSAKCVFGTNDTTGHCTQVCVRRCRGNAHDRMLPAGEQGGVILDARRMSYRTGARQDFGAHKHRNSSRKANRYTVVGGAFVACLMVGCAWTVYANVFGASVYPDAIVGNFDVAVMKRSPAPAAPAFDDVFAALSAPAPLSSAPVNLTLGPSLTFSDRFAASSPQGEAPRPQPVSPPADRQGAALAPPPSPDRQGAPMARLPVPRPADA